MTIRLSDGPVLTAARFEFPEAARDRHLRLFFDYWRGKGAAANARGGRLPGRQDVDPIEMRAFLPYVIMFDVVREPGGTGRYRYRFRHRLVGTHIVDLFGHDVTGLYVDQTSTPETYPEVYERLAPIVDTGRPGYGIYPVPTPHRDFIEYEHLTVPLASDGETVDILFGVRCGLSRG